jgi:hypothetical protein
VKTALLKYKEKKMKIAKYLLGGLIAVLVLTAFAPLAVPTKPVLVSPINKAVKVNPDAVTLKWSKSTATTPLSIDSYDVEVSESSSVQANGSFVSTVDSGNVGAPVVEYAIPAGSLNYGRTYYWHVRANDSAPSTSAWSITGAFRVGVEPPTVNPFAPADLLTLRPTFKWTPGAQNADNYTIQISMDPGFSTIYRTATIPSTAVPSNQYIPTTDLAPNILFHWRVRANNALLGTSDWSAPGSFTSANPPSIPVLVSPNGTKVSPTPKLTWKPVSLQASETFGTYEIQIFDTKIDVNNATPVFSADDTVEPSLGDQIPTPPATTLSYTVPVTANLLPATTYYWRVKAYNGDGEYSTSTLFTFFTTIVGEIDSATMDPGETLGNVPGLEGPAFATAKTIFGFTGTVRENANLLSLRPIFKWDPGALNAETLTLQVASYASGSCNVADPEKSTFASMIINVSLPFSESEYTANLDKYPNYILCWRIRGGHSLYGSSDWSDVQIFKAANPPGIPEPIAPVDGTLTNDNSPRFVWNKVSLPSGTVFGKYEVEISYNSNFKGYDYLDDTIPPYGGDVDPASYPLPAPILPGNIVLDPIYSIVPPRPLFPKFPIVDQAHNPITDLANKRDEPWYDVEPETVAGPPEGNPLYGAHTYYWRVRSYNSAGEYSAWSVSRSIKITVDRPTGLVITDCAGTIIPDAITPRPCFDWDTVYKANMYRIIIATNNTFSPASIIYSALTSSSQHQPTIDLPKDRDLYWRVYASYPPLYGTSVSSLIASFHSANPPSTPKPISPVANKLVIPTTLEPTPVFRWARSPYPFGTTFDHYEIEIAWDKNFAFLVESPAHQTAPGDDYELSYAIAAGVLTPARTYYWRVRACNDEVPNECSTWSPTNYFRTAVGAPTLVAPPVPDPVNPLRLTFAWNAVDDATSYTIWISKSPSCVSPVISASVPYTSTSYKNTQNLTATVTYYWCVRANNPTYGPSAWSTIDTFTP